MKPLLITVLLLLSTSAIAKCDLRLNDTVKILTDGIYKDQIGIVVGERSVLGVGCGQEELSSIKIIQVRLKVEKKELELCCNELQKR